MDSKRTETRGSETVEPSAAREADEIGKKLLPPTANAAPVLGKSMLKVRQLLEAQRRSSHTSTRNDSPPSSSQAAATATYASRFQKTNFAPKPTSNKRRHPLSMAISNTKDHTETAKRLWAMLRPPRARKEMNSNCESAADARGGIHIHTGNVQRSTVASKTSKTPHRDPSPIKRQLRSPPQSLPQYPQRSPQRSLPHSPPQSPPQPTLQSPPQPTPHSPPQPTSQSPPQPTPQSTPQSPPKSPPTSLTSDVNIDSPAHDRLVSTPKNRNQLSCNPPVPSRSSTPRSPRIPRKKGIGKEATSDPSTLFVNPSLQHRNGRQTGGNNRSLPTFTNEKVSILSEGRKSERLNHGSLYIRPVLDKLQEQGFIHFIDVHRNLAAGHRGGNVEESTDGFIQAKSEQDRWNISFLHEIAASLHKTVSEGNYKHLELSTRSRTEALDGLFIEIVAGLSRNRILPYDCLYHAPACELHTTGVVLDPGSDYAFSETGFLVLDWFECECGNGRTFHMGSILHELTKLYALWEMTKPTSELASALSVILGGNSQRKWDLFQEALRKPLPDWQVDSRSRNISAAAAHLRELRQRKLFNVQEADIVERCLFTCHMYKTIVRSEEARLNRILLVSGVPGCGKTYTAVHMIATFLLYFNPESARSYYIPYWLGSVLVLTKINKALDVTLDRLEYVVMPTPSNGWRERPIPCFCKHFASYLSRDDCNSRIRRAQTDDQSMLKDVPVILSTFGNLKNLLRHFVQSFGTYEDVLRWFAENVKAVVIDEGSHSVALDVLFFLMIFSNL